MILSRAKPALGPGSSAQGAIKAAKEKRQLPTLEDYIKQRDYVGAMTLLDFTRSSGNDTMETSMWIAFCAFHLGEYKKALEEYQSLVKKEQCPPDVWVFLGCCYFLLGMYEQSEKATQRGPSTPLQNRLLFHLAHKFHDDKKLMQSHRSLQDKIEDQLSLASIHYLRSHYQEAIDVYKKILLDNKDYLALNVYVALCYYKLDFYDVSQEVLAVYLQNNPDSFIALNLKACNHYRLFNGKAAEAELRNLKDVKFGQQIIKHNMVVFRNGEGAVQTLTPLIDVIPEARLNLVIYYMKQGDLDEAYALIKDVEPSTPQQYILKGVVNAAIGQQNRSKEHLKIAQQYFQLVGGSASECDTIPGRQCMSSCFFLLRQFDDVAVYFNSIKSYFYNDDTFNFNYGQAKAATGAYKDAEEAFLQIQNEEFKADFVYISWLARCYIMNKTPKKAWALYLNIGPSSEQFSLLQLIANDCYKMGQFFFSAKAFDVLERLDPNPEFWEGKRGSCVGVFQLVIAGKEPRESLKDVVLMLKNTSRPQAEFILTTIKKWANENRVSLQ